MYFSKQFFVFYAALVIFYFIALIQRNTKLPKHFISITYNVENLTQRNIKNLHQLLRMFIEVKEPDLRKKFQSSWKFLKQIYENQYQSLIQIESPRLIQEYFLIACQTAIDNTFNHISEIILQFQKRERSIMSFSLHNSEEFNRARQQEALQFAQQPELPEVTKQPLAITNVVTGENQSFLYQFLARTQPQDLPKYEISFQKNFLDQHIKTIEAILWNSEESIPISSSQQKLPSQEVHNSTYLSPPYKISLLSFLETHQISTQLTATDQLIKDLEKERDLSELINYFINKYSKEVAVRLIILTEDIWSSVRHHKFPELETQDLQRISSQWVRLNSKKYLQRPDSQTFRNIFKLPKANLMQNSADQNFSNRLMIFTATLLLVVGGFFQNPYADSEIPIQFLSQVDYPKRYSSCQSFGFWSCSQLFSEEELQGEPQKKRKSQ